MVVYLQQKQKPKAMTTQTTTTDLTNRITELVTDPNFIRTAAEAVKVIGITPKEWNENRMMILMILANEMI